MDDGQWRKSGRTRMIRATDARFVQLAELGTFGKGFVATSESAVWMCLVREAGSVASSSDIIADLCCAYSIAVKV